MYVVGLLCFMIWSVQSHVQCFVACLGFVYMCAYADAFKSVDEHVHLCTAASELCISTTVCASSFSKSLQQHVSSGGVYMLVCLLTNWSWHICLHANAQSVA